MLVHPYFARIIVSACSHWPIKPALHCSHMAWKARRSRGHSGSLGHGAHGAFHNNAHGCWGLPASSALLLALAAADARDQALPGIHTLQTGRGAGQKVGLVGGAGVAVRRGA